MSRLVAFCLSMSAQERQRLREEAEAQRITVSALVRDLVDRYLREHYNIQIHRTATEQLKLAKLKHRGLRRRVWSP